MVARSSSISRECAGVSGGRCEGGGVETPELPGPLLREGKVEPGSVPNDRRPRTGSSADKCSSIPSPSPSAPACPMASGPRLLQPRGVRASLGPQLRGVCHQAQGEDTGPGPQGGRGAVGALCTCSPPCLAPLESPLGGAAPCTTTGGGLWVCRRCLGPVTAAARIRDGGCHQGARNWGRRVCVGSAGSAGVKGSLLWGCVPVMWAHISVILFAGRWQRVFRWDLLLFPKAFWRIR